MFRILKFSSAAKAYWAYGSKIKFKQSTKETSINSYYPREDLANDILIISSQQYKNSSGENSNEKRRCNNKNCFNFLNFYSDNFGLKVGAVGTVHYILNHLDVLQKDDFCPVLNFKNLAQYIIDRVILTSVQYNEFICNFNVIPKSSSMVISLNKASQELNIKKYTSLDNIHIDFNDSPDIKEVNIIQNDDIESCSNITIDVYDQLKNNNKAIEFKNLEKSSNEEIYDSANLNKILLDLQCELANNVAVKLADKGSYIESIEAWKLILEKNPTFAKANFNLALCYQEGFGVTKNIKKACNLYEESIALGHIASYYNLAVILLNECSNCNDKEAELKAYSLLNFAAENGLSNATDALIHLSLAKDEPLNIESHFPKNAFETEYVYNQQLPSLQDVDDSLTLPMASYNSIIDRHCQFNNKNDFSIYNELSQDSTSQISSDIQFTDSDEDEITTFIKSGNKKKEKSTDCDSA